MTLLISKIRRSHYLCFIAKSMFLALTMPSSKQQFQINLRSNYISNRKIPSCLWKLPLSLIGAERQTESGVNDTTRKEKASSRDYYPLGVRTMQIASKSRHRVFRIYWRRNGSRRYETTNYNE